jgi:aminopeptidase N
MVAVSNGLNDSTIEGPNATTWYWSEEYPCATYLLTFAVAPYEKLEFTDSAVHVPMQVWTLPDDSFATGETFSMLPRMVKAYESRFVPYPFEKVGYVNTPQGAMEHQTLISFPRAISVRGNPVNSIGAHELAHQWFGDLVTPVDFRHAWLNESFATWCEALWQEELNGFEGYLTSMQVNLDSYVGSDRPFEGDLPLYDYSRESPSSNYPATIYDKGAVVVGMLRFELGDSLFFQTLRTYLERNAYANVQTSTFQNVAEEVSGEDLGWFFNQWVYRPAMPIVQLSVSNDSPDGSLDVHAIQSSSIPDTPFVHLPIELTLLLADTAVHRLIRMDSLEQSFDLKTPGRVYDVLVNRGPSLRTLAQFTLENLLTVDERPSLPKSQNCLDVEASNGSSTTTVTVSQCQDWERSAAPLIEHDIRIRVFSMDGRLIGTHQSDSLPCRFDLPGLPPGHYFLHLESNVRAVSLPFEA